MSDRKPLGERIDHVMNAVDSFMSGAFFIAGLGGALVSIVMLLVGYQGDYLGYAFSASLIGFMCMILHGGMPNVR